ncbi:hypothetical protein [Nitratiruptor sp. YY09-18]|uniref:hypothetical protein n=1 Tax=Nitratiruptor sp. YY09-18 TaxID=2724901 RepID=UPI0019155303|nr:hypothetical protein [Nitratiruptor sp. YY09-18]BCD68581.1 hypothetical protein NitYY0918_C1498 [Nitratiruptor sp. YY09-18]
MAKRECLFLDTSLQYVTDSKENPQEYYYIDHSGWYIAIPYKEINKAVAAGATKDFISPFSFLFLQYQKDPRPNRLYSLATEEYIYLTTFYEDRPAYYKILSIKENKEFFHIVEQFLKEFYAQENSYFIEEVIYYRFYNLLVIFEEELEQNLGVVLRIVDIDHERDFCHEEEFTKYLIQPLMHEEESFWKRNILSLVVGTAAIIVLIGYDFYIKYDTKMKKEQIAQLRNRQITLANQNNAYTATKLKQQKIDPILQSIDEKNSLITEKIKYIFNLVPEDVYLTFAEFNKGAIIIKGVGISKKSVQKLLQINLAKIFTKKHIDIRKTKEGYVFEAVFEEATQ